MNEIRPLADDFVRVVESPSSQDVFCFSPGIAVLPNGDLLVTMDFGGPGVRRMEGSCPISLYPHLYQAGCAYLSEDGGKSWKKTTSNPLCHSRPFVAGNSVYIIGQAGDLGILRSDDNGKTWSDTVFLTHGELWHQAPSNVWYANDCIYLVMEYLKGPNCGWPVNAHAPVLMRGKIGTDLLRKENWTFASRMIFHETVRESDLEYFGVPFYKTSFDGSEKWMPLGWLETQIVQFQNPADVFTDPTGHTFHLFMRTNSGLPNIAAMAKVVEKADGSMETTLETAPSGKTMLFFYLPGGQMKFHILYDAETGTYWLLSSQCTDSLKKWETMPPRRGDPVNERHRLVLHFSRNCFDWCFAGVVAIGPDENQSRHYASMAIRGNDLLIVSRSGDKNAQSNHNTNFISFHVVRGFRRLIY